MWTILNELARMSSGLTILTIPPKWPALDPQAPGVQQRLGVAAGLGQAFEHQVSSGLVSAASWPCAGC